MANPQLEDGHSSIANELLEAIIHTHFSPMEHSIFWAVVRKTYGWHKKSDRISFTQFEELTGINRRHISPTLQGLINRNIIIRTGDGYNLEYSIQKDYTLWKSLPKTVTKIVTENSNKSLPNPVMITSDKSLPILDQSLPNPVNIVTESCNEIVTAPVITKERKQYTKETIQKQYVFPEWLDLEVWNGFVEMRKKIKAPLTEKAIDLIIKDLDKLKNFGDNPNEVLEQSIKKSWRGVFPLKRDGGNGYVGANGAYAGGRKGASGAVPPGGYTSEQYHKPLE